MKQLTKKPSETQDVGIQLAKEILLQEGPNIILLYGDLGAGKTTFMQGFAKGLGIEKRIISPTFIIVRKYEVQNNKELYHVDLYRTQTEDDLKGLGIGEVLENESAIVAIEWPEKLGSFLPEKRWELHFETVGENERSITIEKYE